jgi:hypothetical protein
MNGTSKPSIMLNGYFTINSQSDILYHLTALNSTESIPLTFWAYSAIIFVGNGYSVIGLSKPILNPSFLASFMAF